MNPGDIVKEAAASHELTEHVSDTGERTKSINGRRNISGSGNGGGNGGGSGNSGGRSIITDRVVVECRQKQKWQKSQRQKQ
jgi:hypothetical protein